MTGGTGLIGGILSKALHQRGCQLTVLSRHPDTVISKCGPGTGIFTSLDQWNPEQVFDVVINLAGEPIADKHWSVRQKQEIRDSRVTLTQQLVRKIATVNRKPTVLLSGSAIGYYGSRGNELLDETSAIGRGFSADLCGDWESAALQAEGHGVRVCLLRTGLVLSENGGLLSRMRLPFGFGVRLGDGKQWMSWIHIDDYIRILLFLMFHPNARGPFNMTSPNPVTNGDFAKSLKEAQRGLTVLSIPSVLLKLLLSERATLLLEGQRVLPKKIESFGYSFLYPGLPSALTELRTRQSNRLPGESKD